MTREELLEVVEKTLQELDKRGAEVRLELCKVEPVVEGWLTRFERAAQLEALAALVKLEATGLEAERWASDIGSSYPQDPRNTDTSAVLRKLLAAAGVLT